MSADRRLTERRLAQARYLVPEWDLRGTFIVLRDVGPWTKHPTITNDADAVVRDLVAAGRVAADGRIFYYDSAMEPGELLHDGTIFTGFAPWDGRTP